jgi:hypothetical protein
MLSDADKANQQTFARKVKELENLLHDLGGTKRNAPQFASPELAYANKKLREAGHWMREHYFTNVMSKTSSSPRPPSDRANGVIVERKGR